MGDVMFMRNDQYFYSAAAARNSYLGGRDEFVCSLSEKTITEDFNNLVLFATTKMASYEEPENASLTSTTKGPSKEQQRKPGDCTPTKGLGELRSLVNKYGVRHINELISTLGISKFHTQVN